MVKLQYHTLARGGVCRKALGLAGHAIAQTMEFGIRHLLADGRLIDLFPDWPDEHFPLYALYPSRHHVPAKTRVFLDFVSSLHS